MVAWRTAAHLVDHFERHGAKLGCTTVGQYDASAQDTLMVGTYFAYHDETSGEDRIGCYHEPTRRLVVQDLEDRIVSHYPAEPWYIRNLPDNNYDR